MFLNSILTRHLAGAAILGALFSAPIASYGYDLQKGNYEVVPPPPVAPPIDEAPKPPPRPPIIPLDKLIPHLLPGSGIFEVDHCGLAYTICQFGENSWDHLREQQLREEIQIRDQWIQNLDENNPLDQTVIDRLRDEIAELRQELEALFDGRPVPQEGDECLKEYRDCLMEEYKNPTEPGGAF